MSELKLPQSAETNILPAKINAASDSLPLAGSVLSKASRNTSEKDACMEQQIFGKL